MLVALTETQDSAGGEHALHCDRFGLSIGPVSVGLPMACTADQVYRRYLDLMQLLQRGPVDVIVATRADLDALAAATANNADFIARRLAALQAGNS